MSSLASTSTVVTANNIYTEIARLDSLKKTKRLESNRKHLEVVEDNVQNYEVFPRTVDELKVVLKEEWEKLDVSVFEEIIASMPRIDAVLKANGAPRKYSFLFNV
ncbi:6066_t:CDS:2 [Ambispora gerdemannii]|uniref:6066_t:CDS:1 n=1 Tax=Ambispora gerdemannii TaxID=144530 RepID=A0A9N9CY75_9GLOM|nr:6066_t:CDS:2 [Ambispora gerdemannii]